jgi:glycosyltransferase involved in cell wall biosynthesis
LKPLHVLYSFPTRLGVPGIGTTAWHQVQGLADLGVRVSLFCGSVERPLRGVERIVETMKLGPVPLSYRAIGLDRAMAWHDARVARALRRHCGGVDVVHCWPLGSLRTLIAAQDSGIKTLLERPNAHTGFAYDVVAREHARIGLAVPSTHTHAFNQKRLEREEHEYQAASKLACPSDFVASSFQAHGFQSDRIARHQYGFDPEQFSAGPNGNGEPHPFTVTFVGRCEPRKGLHYALQAWHESGAAAAGGRFLIAGTFIEGYESLLGQWLNHPSVVRLGFTPDVTSLMRSSDALILPSLEEGSALVTYEARACGCALLVSEATGAPCEHMRHGLIHRPGDVQMLSEHLKMLLQDADLLRRLRAMSRDESVDLTWASAAKRLRTIYCQLCDSGPRPAPLPAVSR